MTTPKKSTEEFKYLSQQCEDDACWGARHFHLDKYESIKFRDCLKFSYLGIEPTINYEFFEMLDFDIFGDNWEEVGATPVALLFAVRNIYKDRLRSYRELIMPEEHYLDICIGKSKDYSIISESDDCLAASLAADSSKNNRLKYFLNNASKITISKRNNKVIKCQIQTKNFGSLRLSDFYIDILNEEESESELLSSFKRGTTTFDEKVDIEAFKNMILRYVIIPFGQKEFIYGQQRNSLRKRFIETMYPVVEMIDQRLRVQCAIIFKDMSKRDIYRFILKLFDAEDIFTVELMERYLKVENLNAKYNFDWMMDDPEDEVMEYPF